VTTDGEEALAFLYKSGKYAGSETPDLILLDLNLPARSGSEVLAEIKNDENLKVIPVIILTTSRQSGTLYMLQAACKLLVNKPFGFDTLTRW